MASNSRCTGAARSFLHTSQTNATTDVQRMTSNSSTAVSHSRRASTHTTTPTASSSRSRLGASAARRRHLMPSAASSSVVSRLSSCRVSNTSHESAANSNSACMAMYCQSTVRHSLIFTPEAGTS